MPVGTTALSLSWAALAAAAAVPSKPCTLGTLQGQYVFAGRGYIEPLEPGVQRVHYGIFVFDGAGKLTGKQSSSRGGKIGRETLVGTYVVRPDCSGVISFGFTDKPDSLTHWDVYLTPEGRIGHMIRMDDGAMAVRTFQK